VVFSRQAAEPISLLGHKKLGMTLLYARAHDQTEAEAHFASMERVEERLEIVQPRPKRAWKLFMCRGYFDSFGGGGT